MDLQVNTTIKTSIGEITILEADSKLKGAQGRIFKVKYNGEIYALKDGIGANCNGATIEEIEYLLRHGPGSRLFVWPERLLEYNGEYAYLMKYVSDEYKTIKDSLYELTPKTCLGACINLCDAFQALFDNKLCYKDVSQKNILVRASDGDIRIIDNDNVTPVDQIDSPHVVGSKHMVAPEILDGKVQPNAKSDLWSLAVLLFLLLVGCYANKDYRFDHLSDDPEVKKLSDVEKVHYINEKFYSSDNVHFIFADDPINLDKYISKQNPNWKEYIYTWSILPSYLKEDFLNTFVHGIKDYDKRTNMDRWKKDCIRALASRYECPHCGKIGFFDYQYMKSHNLLDLKKPYNCQCPNANCNKTIKIPFMKAKWIPNEPSIIINLDNNDLFNVYFSYSQERIKKIAEVKYNQRGLLFITNLSDFAFNRDGSFGRNEDSPVFFRYEKIPNPKMNRIEIFGVKCEVFY